MKPGILEEVAYRFLFLGLVLTALRGAMAPRRAAIVAITLPAAFQQPYTCRSSSRPIRWPRSP